MIIIYYTRVRNDGSRDIQSPGGVSHDACRVEYKDSEYGAAEKHEASLKRQGMLDIAVVVNDVELCR